MIKTTGAEWRAFIEDDSAWAKDEYYEDEIMTVDGVVQGDDGLVPEEIPPDAEVTVEGGFVWDGSDQTVTLEAKFIRWRREQAVVRIAVECDKEAQDNLRAAIKAAGGRIVR